MARLIGLRNSDYYSVRDSDGAGTTDSAYLWSVAASRAWAVRTERAKTLSFGFVDAAFGDTFYTKGQGFKTSGSADDSRELALFFVPNPGNGTAEVTVRILLDGGTVATKFFAQSTNAELQPGEETLIANTSTGG